MDTQKTINTWPVRIGIMVVGAGLMLGWLHGIVPWLEQLPADFQYEAELASYDNLYDEKLNDFAGENRSITRFFYEAAGQSGGVLTIKNSIEVHGLTGNKIFAVERRYGIDVHTGQHVQGSGDRDRGGYLFAPRHLHKGESFTYWHANYDGPAHMKFANEETLFGLPVYRYETRYEGVIIDQTKNLGFLPDVGKTRGVRVEPYLQVWIEPLTGYMVKYKDDSVAYFYDLKTGEQLQTWNHFRNSYMNESVLKHVELATAEKMNSIFVEESIPGLFIVFALLLVLLTFPHSKKRTVLLCALFAFGIMIGSRPWLACSGTKSNYYSGPTETIRLGIDKSMLPSLIWVAEHNGYLKDQGIDLEIREFSSGRDALENMLSTKKLDIVTVAQTPFANKSFTNDNLEIFAGIASTGNDVKILVRKDRNIRSAADLKGKNIGVINGTVGNYFLGMFLAQHNMTLEDLQLEDIKAAALPEALHAGQVDAIVIWEPFAEQARQLLKENITTLESKGIFREDFYLATWKQVSKKKPNLLKRLLAALSTAETYMQEHPEESQKIVADRLKLDPVYVSSIWTDYSFHLFLDQAVLLTFEQQARWMIANKLVKNTSIPNYLNFINTDALQAVSPKAVTIIQ